MTRVWLCGDLVARIGDRRIDDGLPGRQGRLLFAFLVLERSRPVARDELGALLWEDAPPAGADSSLSSLLSRLRRVAPLEGTHELRMRLAADAWVDVEAARAALHRAESAVSRCDWDGAWSPARVAQHITARRFLAGVESGWADSVRGHMGDMHVRALECAARAALGIGGSEVATAERTARALVRAAPYRETGYGLLMDALAAGGNRAEAVRVFEDLRVLLRDELGIAPGPALRDRHTALVAGS